MNRLKLAIAGAIAAVVAVALWMQHRSATKLRVESESLRQQVEQLPLLSAENERLSNLLAKADNQVGSNQLSEILRLRGEVAALRRQVDEAVRKEKARATVPQPQRPPQADQMEREKAMAIAKLQYAKNWLKAFYEYAAEHQGQFPTNFDLAAPFLSDEMRSQTNLAPEKFEIVFSGSVIGMTIPSRVIVIREREASQTLDGGWVKGYGFGDGHSEIHRAADGNFQPWEAEHMIAQPAAGPADH